MPELPEVECLTRGLREVSVGRKLAAAKFMRADLREPIPIAEFERLLVGQVIRSVSRRSKFLLVAADTGIGIFHLGMSGNILSSPGAEPQLKHTHAVFTLTGGGAPIYLHFIDPRRFGCISCCQPQELSTHRLLHRLGPEPLDFPGLGKHIFQTTRGKSTAIKSFLMDAHNLVGVGNIYANESLYHSKIHPLMPASHLKATHCDTLGLQIQKTLTAAVAQGGTTLRDFRNSDGNPGYFKLALSVYGRGGEPCNKCTAKITAIRLGGRATYFCPTCQKQKN